MIVVLSTVACFGIFSYNQAINDSNFLINEKLKFANDYMPKVIPDDFMQKVINNESESDEVSFKVAFDLTELNNTLGIAYVYPMIMDKNGDIFYVSSSLTEKEVQDKNLHYRRTAYDEAAPVAKIKETLSTRKDQILEYTSEYGTFRTLYSYKTTKNGSPYVVASDITMGAIDNAQKEVLISILIISSIAVVVSILISIILGNIITKNLNILTDAIKQLSSGNGDLTYTLDIKSKDETGIIANNFNSFIANLNEMIKTIKADSADLSKGLTNINSLMNSLANDANNQTERATNSAATIEEITATMRNIVESTDLTTQLVSEADKNSTNSSLAVTRLSQEIGTITNSANELSKLITNLETRSFEISKIVDVIRGIAEQTNLLALNASIEAARAGEQGRGFAVVADEVRNLAGKTAQATLDISDMIKAISVEIVQANSKMSETNSAVSSGVTLAKNAISQIDEIQHSMKQVVENIHVINHATKEQSIATADMARSATDLTTSSNLSKDVVEQTRETVEQLDNLSKSLNDLVSQFKTK
jgi:methyl-accepting chemotaxis protein